MEYRDIYYKYITRYIQNSTLCTVKTYLYDLHTYILNYIDSVDYYDTIMQNIVIIVMVTIIMLHIH